MKRYDKYVPTGVDWLPEIPSDWELSKTKYIFKYTTGFTPPTGQDEFYNEDIIWITIADMDKKVVEDSATKLSSMAIEKYQPEITPKGSLLFSFKLSVGKVAFAGKNLYTNEAIISIPCNNKYDVRYFYYSLPDQLLKNANENIYGAKILNQELIRNAIITLPPIGEQTAIADYLDSSTLQIDNLISQKRKLIELLNEEFLGLSVNLVRFGLKSNVELVDYDIDWFEKGPKHWTKTAIKYVASAEKDSIVDGPFGSSVNVDTDYVNEGIPVIRTVNITDTGFNNDDLRFMRNEKFQELKRHAIYPGDVLFSKVGTIGNCCIFPESYSCGILSTTGSCKITVTPDIIINNYLVIVLRAMKEHFAMLASSNVQPFLNMATIKSIRLLIPPKNEQIEILSVITDKAKQLSSVIFVIQKEIDMLVGYRDSLISEVVTGKIKVIA